MNNIDFKTNHSFINSFTINNLKNTKMNTTSVMWNNENGQNQKISPCSEGYLELILGPMFSGKTSTLKKIYDQCMYCNIPVMVINYEADNRYCDASFMSTHDKIMIPCVKGVSISEILEVNKEKLNDSEVILIRSEEHTSELQSH